LPIADAKVLVENSALAVTSDREGWFRIARVSVGAHILCVEETDHTALSHGDVWVSRGQISALTLELEPRVQPPPSEPVPADGDCGQSRRKKTLPFEFGAGIYDPVTAMALQRA
jgi:hypothetical protein